MLEQQQQKRPVTLDNILVKLYIIILFIPFIVRKMDGISLLVLLLVWVCFSLYRYRRLKVKDLAGAMTGLVLMTIYAVVRYYTTRGNVSAFGNVSVYILFGVFYFVQCLFSKAYKREELIGFMRLAYACILFTAFTSFISLCIDLEASKIVTGMGPDTVFYKWHNVADYLYCFLIGLASILSIYFYKLTSGAGKRNFWYLAASLFLLVVMVMCSSLIALGFTAISLFIFLIISIRNKKARHICYGIIGGLFSILLVLYFAVPMFLYDITVNIAEAMPIGNFVFRIKELAESMFITKEFSFTGRVDLWQASFDSIASSPWVGVGFHTGGDKLSAHSQIFDDIAKLGVLGYGIMVGIFCGSAKTFVNNRKTMASKLYLSIIIGVAMFSIFNLSLSQDMLFFLMIILPICAKVEKIDAVVVKGKRRGVIKAGGENLDKLSANAATLGVISSCSEQSEETCN